MKNIYAVFLSALILSAPCFAQTSDQMPEKQGEWQRIPDTAAKTQDQSAPAWMQYNSPYSTKQQDLSVSHMAAPEISTWAQETVSDVLSFGPADYTERLTGFKKYFIVSGWQGYAEYMSQNGLADLVKGQQYALNAIVNDPPHVLKEGSISGTYRWLVETSAVLSLSRENSDGQSQAVPATTRRIKILTQLVRVADDRGVPAGLAIENWNVQEATAVPTGPGAQRPAMP